MQKLVRQRVVLGCVLFGVLFENTLFAIRTGQIRGKVSAEGEPLPGVFLTLTSEGGEWTFISKAAGNYRFLSLDKGTYKLTAELSGFSSKTYEDVTVQVRPPRYLDIEMQVSTVAEVITVTFESPLTDERVVQIATNVERSDLERVPRQADPWSVIAQAAGVIVEAADGASHPPVFTALGSSSQNNVVALDGGAALATMTIAGPAPDFSDLGSFEEVQIVTGGNDVTTPTSGVQVNLVTRRGTNKWRGSGRYHLTPGGERRAILAPPVLSSESGIGDPTPNEVDEIKEYGLEGGGSVFPDRLWAWGALGRRRLDLLAAGGQLDATAVDSETYKLNTQLSDSGSGFLSFKEGNNHEVGRGAGPRRARETTWDQVASQKLWTVEEAYTFESGLHLVGSLSGAEEDLTLVPLGDADAGPLRDSSGVWRRDFYSLASERRAHQFRMDASSLLEFESSDHELKLGGNLMREKLKAAVAWPGPAVVSIQGENFGLAEGLDVAVVTREGQPAAEVLSGGLWLQDTFTVGELTANIGLRVDGQKGKNEAGAVAASPVQPDLLPALHFGGDADRISWEDLSPRAAITWNMGKERSTLLGASYARFAERLSIERVLRTHPLSLTSALHFFTDSDGDQILDPGELGPLFFCDNCVEGNPAQPRATNRNARSLKASLTDELTARVEHAFQPEFIAALMVVYRRLSRIPEERVLLVAEGGEIRSATRSDYRQDGVVTGTLPDGSSYLEPFFALRPGLLPTGGTLLVSGDREQEYRGVSLTVAKRFADRWMLRGQATWSDWTWQVPNSFDAFDDPTDLEDPGDDDGIIVAERLPAPLGETGEWLGGRWSFDLAGLYQVAPGRAWGFDVAGRITGSEGTPSPLFHRVVGSDGIIRDVAVTEFGRFREEDLLTVDLRLAKDLSIGSWKITLSLDAFNLFNRTPALVRERNQALPTAGTINESALPRTLRWGLAVRFH